MSRTIVVTGAGSGFGRDTVERFVADGWTVFAGIRDPRSKHAETTASLERKGIRVVDLEITDQASVDRAAAEILAAGPVDVLVNNAGISFAGVVEAFTPETLERQYQVNVFGPMRVSRAFLPAMRARRSGLLVYVSSVAGRIAFPFLGVYASSKWGLEALVEASAYELKPFGVDVALVQPGAYSTNIASSRVNADDAERLKAYAEVTPLAANVWGAMQQGAAQRDSREVAEAIFALASLPAGSRPLRTPVPENPGIAAINATHAKVQRALLEGIGLGQLIPDAPEIRRYP